MNGPVSTGITQFLMAATATGQAGGSGLQSSTDSVEGIDFSALLSGEKLTPELLELLRSRLAPEDFARLEEMLESGNELPLPAILGLLPEILEANSAPLDDAVSGSPLPVSTNEQLPASTNDQLAKLLQEVKVRYRENPSLPGRILAGVDNTALSPEEQATLKEILRQVLPARPEMVPVEQASAVLRSGAGVAGEVALAATTSLESGTSNLAQSPALGIISNLSAGSPSTPVSAVPTPPAISIPPGEKGWSQAMGERILWMVGRDLQAASVNIKPPNLGPLHIQISIQNEQASVNFTAQHAVVKEALEAALPRLREMLAENNIQLVNVDVNQRGEGGRGEAADPYQERREADQGLLAQGEGVESESEEPLRYYRSDRLLDDYA
jgi:outer membrane protein OmpA-like peptidoglycan-associated protein